MCINISILQQKIQNIDKIESVNNILSFSECMSNNALITLYSIEGYIELTIQIIYYHWMGNILDEIA